LLVYPEVGYRDRPLKNKIRRRGLALGWNFIKRGAKGRIVERAKKFLLLPNKGKTVSETTNPATNTDPGKARGLGRGGQRLSKKRKTVKEFGCSAVDPSASGTGNAPPPSREKKFPGKE